MTERFTAYITKYALTSGIKQVEVEDCFDSAPDMIREVAERFPAYYHGDDWHRTREEAVQRAEEMRKAKIASVKKQLARLEKLSFAEVVDA